ncbi:MAG: hypothetical protein PVI86_13395 [Phycisphaerae bacterium]|jgi:hypothetical protein
MAKAQQLGQGYITLAMIIFAALWLTSTVLLVILYTGQEQLLQEHDAALETKRKVISSAQERAIPLVQSARASGPTVVGLIEDARAETARLATGEPNDDPPTVKTKLDQRLRTIQSEGLVSKPDSYLDLSYEEALGALYEEFTTLSGLKREAESRVAELQAEADRQVEANARQKNELDRRAQELGDQLAQEQAARAQYRADRDEEIARVKREYEQRNADAERDLTAERERVSLLEERVTLLQTRLKAVQEKFGELMIGPEELSTARREDGRVLTAMPGDDVVFINLGQKDRLTLGLRFAVYSAETGIPADGRAKAQIEVVSIASSSAECKIVRLAPRQVILAGDLVANPVYDPDRPLRFLVLGDFDLDHDGGVDKGGAATIESMIEHWGGEPVSELSALTDFVVVGRAPRRPRATPDSSADQSQRSEMMRQRFEEYGQTIDSAKSLAVPIMTQEVFLSFLGFSGR